MAIDSGTLIAQILSPTVTGVAGVTSTVVIDVYDFGRDVDDNPYSTGTATGQQCTITNPDPSSTAEWTGTCTVPSVRSWTWIGVTATPYSGATPGVPSDSNQVLWAGDDGGDATSPGDSPGMPDIQQALPRSPSDDCAHVFDTGLDWGTGITGGWRPSWAYWANGPVCVRTLTYSGSGWRVA